MGDPSVWCLNRRILAVRCTDHGGHREVTSRLGPDDEPRESGAVVAVWAGDYCWQEVWVASGANAGAWYCLGSEFGVPEKWDPPRADPGSRDPIPARPTGTIPAHPDWDFVLGRGPVTMLSASSKQEYQRGWRAGRRRLHQEIEELAEDDSGAYEPEEHDQQ